MPCTGGVDENLDLLLTEIMPKAKDAALRSAKGIKAILE